LLNIRHSLGTGTQTRRAASAPTSDRRFFRIASLRAVLLNCTGSVLADTDPKALAAMG
jgi:hypothetical protein